MNEARLNAVPLNRVGLNTIGEIRSSAGGGAGGGIDVNNYLTYIALQDGVTVSLASIVPGAYLVEYCIDGDGDWTPLQVGQDSPPINSQQTISFRGNIAKPDGSLGSVNLRCAQKCEVCGDPLSLIYGDEAMGATSVPNYAFKGLFVDTNSGIISAERLRIRFTSSNCYTDMLRNCRNLERGPIIPNIPLAYRCFYSMFNGCKKLSQLTALFVEDPADFGYATNYWMSGVASSGVFVKNRKASWDTEINGVPSGWTIEYADA